MFALVFDNLITQKLSLNVIQLFIRDRKFFYQVQKDAELN